MLKLILPPRLTGGVQPAAFGRLCVETVLAPLLPSARVQPPSGGCVLKLNRDFAVVADVGASRLRAAVC